MIKAKRNEKLKEISKISDEIYRIVLRIFESECGCLTGHDPQEDVQPFTLRIHSLVDEIVSDGTFKPEDYLTHHLTARWDSKLNKFLFENPLQKVEEGEYIK